MEKEKEIEDLGLTNFIYVLFNPKYKGKIDPVTGESTVKTLTKIGFASDVARFKQYKTSCGKESESWVLVHYLCDLDAANGTRSRYGIDSNEYLLHEYFKDLRDSPEIKDWFKYDPDMLKLLLCLDTSEDLLGIRDIVEKKEKMKNINLEEILEDCQNHSHLERLRKGNLERPIDRIACRYNITVPEVDNEDEDSGEVKKKRSNSSVIAGFERKYRKICEVFSTEFEKEGDVIIYAKDLKECFPETKGRNCGCFLPLIRHIYDVKGINIKIIGTTTVIQGCSNKVEKIIA